MTILHPGETVIFHDCGIEEIRLAQAATDASPLQNPQSEDRANTSALL